MDNWTVLEFFCPNCGKRISGIRNKKGILIVICPFCSTKYKCRRESRRLVVIEATSQDFLSK